MQVTLSTTQNLNYEDENLNYEDDNMSAFTSTCFDS